MATQLLLHVNNFPLAGALLVLAITAGLLHNLCEISGLVTSVQLEPHNASMKLMAYNPQNIVAPCRGDTISWECYDQDIVLLAGTMQSEREGDEGLPIKSTYNCHHGIDWSFPKEVSTRIADVVSASGSTKELIGHRNILGEFMTHPLTCEDE